MMSINKYVFETERLRVRKAEQTDEDINFFFILYTNPEVMKFVGFPYGLKISKEEITESISAQDISEFDQALLIISKADNKLLGECKLGKPDKDGISETDVKFLPEYWNKGYGKEIKAGLVEYLFRNTDCTGVKATPNKKNIASQKMQESVGAKRICEGKTIFPENMKEFTTDVEYYEYIVNKQEWLKKKNKN